MENVEKQLREEAKKLLADKKVDVIVGYEEGTIPLQTSPCFITNPDDTGKLVWNSFCSQNLAKYVHDIIHQHRESQVRVKPEDKTKKVVGVVARGCTTRSLVIHLQERQYGRDEIVIIGVPCTGYVAKRKVSNLVDDNEILEVSVNGDKMSVKTAGGDKDIPFKDVIADNCLNCHFNNPVVSDIMIGSEAPPMDVDREYHDVNKFEKLSVEERWAYFTKEMEKCIRCYACRNACPSCYCKVCFVEQSQPSWVGVGDDPTDTQVFQIMRMFHMVGRCVDCGSCVEVCPMGVDLRKFLKKLDKDGFELFNHRAGADLDDPPLLSTHLMEDKEDFIYEPEEQS
ncbi:MAG: 4Fe-4S dicluster domain-containing protein [Syntrophobacterales bacterium]|nr:4Fe-4S dicluster domain-containing protein [Syntrophobacterales bacterium]